MMHPTWLTRILAVALFVFLVGPGQPDAEARQEETPAIGEAAGGDTAISGPYAIMPDRVISTANQPLLALLPGKDDAPAGFILENQSERTMDEVAASMEDPDGTALLLEAWGWSGNVFRDFVLAPDATPKPDSVGFLNISLHRFADEESAASALTYFSSGAASMVGLQDRDVPVIGDTTRLLAGEPDGMPMMLLYVQRDQYLYRIGGTSAEWAGDPTEEMIEVARQLLAAYDEATPSPTP